MSDKKSYSNHHRVITDLTSHEKEELQVDYGFDLRKNARKSGGGNEKI